MKKMFLAILPLLFLLGGCAGGVPDDFSWTEVYAGYSRDTGLYADSVNRVEPPSYIDGEWVRDPALRVYRFTSRQELDAFRAKYDGELELSRGRYDGDPFFDDIAGKYDEAFF